MSQRPPIYTLWQFVAHLVLAMALVALFVLPALFLTGCGEARQTYAAAHLAQAGLEAQDQVLVQAHDELGAAKEAIEAGDGPAAVGHIDAAAERITDARRLANGAQQCIAAGIAWFEAHASAWWASLPKPQTPRPDEIAANPVAFQAAASAAAGRAEAEAGEIRGPSEIAAKALPLVQPALGGWVGVALGGGGLATALGVAGAAWRAVSRYRSALRDAVQTGDDLTGVDPTNRSMVKDTKERAKKRHVANGTEDLIAKALNANKVGRP
jgi:hypothetical protein